VIAISHDRRFLDMVADTIFVMDGGSIKMYHGNYSNFRMQQQKKLNEPSNESLEYLSGPGKKYVVCKPFTNWTTHTKHKVGEKVIIGEHNEKIYEWAIENKFLRPVGPSGKKK